MEEKTKHEIVNKGCTKQRLPNRQRVQTWVKGIPFDFLTISKTDKDRNIYRVPPMKFSSGENKKLLLTFHGK